MEMIDSGCCEAGAEKSFFLETPTFQFQLAQGIANDQMQTLLGGLSETQTSRQQQREQQQKQGTHF
jgi:hypothetical protein